MRNTWSCSAAQSQVSEFCDKGVKHAGVRRIRQTDHLGSPHDHELKGVALRPTHPANPRSLTLGSAELSSARRASVKMTFRRISDQLNFSLRVPTRQGANGAKDRKLPRPLGGQCGVCCCSIYWRIAYWAAN